MASRLLTRHHLTEGCIAWNIVTSYLESTGKNFGKRGLPEHDERYAIADEYLEICYKLWEGSWEDNAVIRDTTRGIYADPAKIWDVKHEGKYFAVVLIYCSLPSSISMTSLNSLAIR